MTKFLLRRRREDRGDAILTMSVIFVGLFALCAGFAIDISKSVYVKSSFQVMAQEATSEAVRNVDVKGSLTEAAAGAVPTNYLAQFNGEAGAFARGDSERCGKVAVDYSRTETVEAVERTVPYMEITLSQSRGDVGDPVYYEYDPDTGLRLTGGSYNPNYSYHVVTARIWDTAPHLMMGIFGNGCQTAIAQVSSVTFGSQTDVEEFYE